MTCIMFLKSRLADEDILYINEIRKQDHPKTKFVRMPTLS